MASVFIFLQWSAHFLMFFDMPIASLMPSWKSRKPRLGKAKKIGRRRYAYRRRQSTSKKRILKMLRLSLFLLFQMIFLWHFQLVWFLSPKDRNKQMHCRHGNGGSGKGGKSGKGSAKSHFLQGLERNDPELEFRQQVKDSMPTAAKLRLQPRLIQSEWDAPILHWQNLNATGGVSICRKESLPQVLANVGYTAHPCAVVITQSPEEVRLQAEIDAGRCVLPELASDPRPRMKVLRLLLVGGLLSPEANHRHRKLPGAITSGCGGNPTNHHISSWECPFFYVFSIHHPSP